ncbi:MAG: ABC transporter substrate-binding protein [Kineosporiaceae bacterium]
MTQWSRREFLTRAGIVSGVALVAPGVLTSCSSGDTGTATPSSGGGSGSAAPAASLLTLLGITPAQALAGEAWKVGAVLPLSGGGEKSYGKSMVDAVNLAVADIAEAGGPKIELVIKDNGTANPQTSVTAVNELGAAGVGCMLSSLVNAFAAMNEGVAKYKILALDGGGGTASWNKGVPYFYGTRAVSPDDAWSGTAKYLKTAFPDKKTWAAVTWQLDPKLNEVDKQAAIARLKEAGLEFSGTYEYVPFGAQDYAAAIAKLKQANADYVMVTVYGSDPGVFASQAKAAGLTSQLVGFEFTDGGKQASRGTWDAGWLFAQDYFDAANPGSDLGRFFATRYKAKYGTDPDFYAANYYEGLLGLWELARRVKADGGDYTKGEQLLKALEAKPTLVSVYGGSGATAGTYTLDATSHSVSQRPIGVFDYRGGKVTPKAFFGPGGSDYRTA